MKSTNERDSHFFLAGWNGARRDVDATEHFQNASKTAPTSCLHQIHEPTVNQQLTDAQIKEGRRAVNDDPDDQPEPWAFREGVKFAERMHGITKENQV